MDPSTTAADPNSRGEGSLLQILGVSFGIAGALGGTIGAGILRTPGLVAAQFGSGPLVMLVWLVGGLYALFGALAVAELGAAFPRAGGWTVYARRALGDQAGFTVGWIDWLGHCAGLAWVAVTIGDYTHSLFPAFPISAKGIALLVLLSFSLIQAVGVQAGSLSQKILSLTKALAFLAVVGACFLLAPPRIASVAAPIALPGSSSELLIAGVFALQAVITTYDGWHSPIYFAEEFAEPATDLPRSLIGGVLAVIALYLLVNLALLRILPMEQLAGSTLPLADAARLLFGGISGQLITGLALISSLGLVNAVIMGAPRILYGLSRDGLFLSGFAQVSSAGTPVVALLFTAGAAALLVGVGEFPLLLAIASYLYVLLYFTGMTSLFVLRWREPELPRPFRDWGYPLTPLIVWLGSLAFLLAASLADSRNSLYALALILLSLPLQWLVRLLRNRAMRSTMAQP